MVCTALINERIQINLFDNLVKKKSANFVPIKDGLLKYVKSDIAGPVLENALYLKKSKDKPDIQSNDVMTFTEYAPDTE